ncbi:MAG TPA: hypothetical protein VLC53_13820, partial [Myxococcota bacterium]|nr:hypothetical protein [Myxococcota bacterium]
GIGGFALDGPQAIVATRDGDVFVAGSSSDTILRIPAADGVEQVLGPAGVEGVPLSEPTALALGPDDSVYVGAHAAVYRLAGGTASLHYTDPAFVAPKDLVVGPDATIYASTDAVTAIAPDGRASQIVGRFGDGVHALSVPDGLALDGPGRLYVAGQFSYNVLRAGTAPDPGAALGGLAALAALALCRHRGGLTGRRRGTGDA